VQIGKRTGAANCRSICSLQFMSRNSADSIKYLNVVQRIW